jgi:hypothetical protein
MMMDAWALHGCQHSSPAAYRGAIGAKSREEYSGRGASPYQAFWSATSSTLLVPSPKLTARGKSQGKLCKRFIWLQVHVATGWNIQIEEFLGARSSSWPRALLPGEARVGKKFSHAALQRYPPSISQSE